MCWFCLPFLEEWVSYWWFISFNWSILINILYNLQVINTIFCIFNTILWISTSLVSSFNIYITQYFAFLTQYFDLSQKAEKGMNWYTSRWAFYTWLTCVMFFPWLIDVGLFCSFGTSICLAIHSYWYSHTDMSTLFCFLLWISPNYLLTLLQ
jgi:hypothetical protein